MSDIVKFLQRKTASLRYIPEVDGIRFVAIFCVFVFHSNTFFDAAHKHDPAYTFFWDTILNNGFKGVHIFFILSGYIIALPFTNHYLQNGPPVRIKDFFMRRFLRLVPAYYFTMITLLLVHVSYEPAKFNYYVNDLLPSLAYIHNLLFDHGSKLNFVVWTLEIEVQFYIIAPLLCLIFCCPAFQRRFFIIMAIFIFGLSQFFIKLPHTTLFEFFHFFLFGLLLADLSASGWPAFLQKPYIPFLSVCFFATAFFLPILSHRWATFLFPYFTFLWMLTVLGNDRVRHFFSKKIFTTLGGMCYSIYLWHEPIGKFIYHHVRCDGTLENYFLVLLCYTLATLLIATIFYSCIERLFSSFLIGRKKY